MRILPRQRAHRTRRALVFTHDFVTPHLHRFWSHAHFNTPNLHPMLPHTRITPFRRSTSHLLPLATADSDPPPPLCHTRSVSLSLRCSTSGALRVTAAERVLNPALTRAHERRVRALGGANRAVPPQGGYFLCGDSREAALEICHRGLGRGSHHLGCWGRGVYLCSDAYKAAEQTQQSGGVLVLVEVGLLTFFRTHATQDVTRSMSHAGCHTQGVTRSMSHAACHTQHVTRSMSHAACHTQDVTRRMSPTMSHTMCPRDFLEISKRFTSDSRQTHTGGTWAHLSGAARAVAAGETRR